MVTFFTGHFGRMDERADELRNVVRTLPRLALTAAVKGAAAAADATEVL